MLIFFLPLIALALICVPFMFIAKKVRTGKACRRAFIGNLCSFAGVMLLAIILPIGGFVSAATEEGVATVVSTGAGLGYLAHGQKDIIEKYNSELAIALLAFGALFIGYMVWNAVKKK